MKFEVGDIVKIRNTKQQAKVFMPIEEEDGSWKYVVEPWSDDVDVLKLDYSAMFEVKEKDLEFVY